MPVRTWSFALTQVGLFFFLFCFARCECNFSLVAVVCWLLLLSAVQCASADCIFIGFYCSMGDNTMLHMQAKWLFPCGLCGGSFMCPCCMCVRDNKTMPNDLKQYKEIGAAANSGCERKTNVHRMVMMMEDPKWEQTKNRQHSAAAYVRILCVYKNKENNYKLWYRYKNAKPKMAGPIFNHHQTSVVSYVAAIFSAAFVRCSLLLLRLSGFFFSCSSLILLPLWKNT